jgi:diadenosine tetraphosphate (Ap4A) HIT family hydrolase
MENCLSCRCNKNPNLAPGGRIKEYEYWLLEHVIEPIPVRGWLILKTKRHTEGIAGLNASEALELGIILNVLPKALKKITGAEIVYMLCLTEEVKHLHFHFIPRMPYDKVKGPAIFGKLSLVRDKPSVAVPAVECFDLIDRLKKIL